MPPDKTASAIQQMISCTSKVESCSPCSFLSNILLMLWTQSFSGSGPGALPPLVTNNAPFGRILLKSNSGSGLPRK